MAALAHAGVGLAAKRLAPSVPVWVLLVLVYLVDCVWAVFWLLGLDHFPKAGIEVPAPWSHSLTMACILSLVAMGAASIWTRSVGVRLLAGGLVFSHWAVDFITQPMRAAFPGAGFRMRVFFTERPTIEGLGLYSSSLVLNVVEYGALCIGVAVCVFAIRHTQALLRGERGCPTRR